MKNISGKETTMSDTVNHPAHYTSGGIECIEAIKASMTADGFADYCKGNIILRFGGLKIWNQIQD